MNISNCPALIADLDEMIEGDPNYRRMSPEKRAEARARRIEGADYCLELHGWNAIEGAAWRERPAGAMVTVQYGYGPLPGEQWLRRVPVYEGPDGPLVRRADVEAAAAELRQELGSLPWRYGTLDASPRRSMLG